VTERGRSRYARNGRPVAARKQHTPPWVVAVFIGIPSVAILILLGIKVTQWVAPAESAPEPAPVVKSSPEDGERLLREARAIVKRARAMVDEGAAVEKTIPLFRDALGKLDKAQQEYQRILDEVARQNNGEVPPDFRGYEQKIADIQRDKQDVVKMMPL
jgi:hypothetical protein